MKFSETIYFALNDSERKFSWNFHTHKACQWEIFVSAYKKFSSCEEIHKQLAYESYFFPFVKLLGFSLIKN